MKKLDIPLQIPEELVSIMLTKVVEIRMMLDLYLPTSLQELGFNKELSK